MIRNVVDLEQRWRKLTDFRASLSERLRSTADSLRTIGSIPPSELIDSVNDYQTEFDSLRTELDLSSSPAGSSVESSWSLFSSRMAILRQAEQACAQLRCVDQLMASPGSLELLDPIRAERTQIIERLETAPWNEADLISRVQDNSHPLQRLFALVVHLRDLSDDEWATEMSCVQQAFGIAVATAIARGKITLADPSDDDTQ